MKLDWFMWERKSYFDDETEKMKTNVNRVFGQIELIQYLLTIYTKSTKLNQLHGIPFDRFIQIAYIQVVCLNVMNVSIFHHKYYDEKINKYGRMKSNEN